MLAGDLRTENYPPPVALLASEVGVAATLPFSLALLDHES